MLLMMKSGTKLCLSIKNIRWRSLWRHAYKADIAVGHNADQLIVIHDGKSGDMVFAHQLNGFADCIIGAYRYGVAYHSVFGLLYFGYFVSLCLYAHVFMNDAYAAASCHGNCHCGFRYRVQV